MSDYALTLFMPTNGFRYQAIDLDKPGELLFSVRGPDADRLLILALEQVRASTTMNDNIQQVRASIDRELELSEGRRSIAKSVERVDERWGGPCLVQLTLRLGYILRRVPAAPVGVLDFDALEDFWGNGQLSVSSN